MCCCHFALYGSGAVRFKITDRHKKAYHPTNWKSQTNLFNLSKVWPLTVWLSVLYLQESAWPTFLLTARGLTPSLLSTFFSTLDEEAKFASLQSKNTIEKKCRAFQTSSDHGQCNWQTGLNTHFVSDMRLTLFIQLHWPYKNSLQFWNRKHQWLSRLHTWLWLLRWIPVKTSPAS